MAVDQRQPGIREIISSQTNTGSMPASTEWRFKDYLFWGFIGFLGLITISSVARIINPKAFEPARMAQPASPSPEKKAEPVVQRAPLKIRSWSCYSEVGFQKAEGEVKNQTDQPMDNIVAVAAYYTSDGTYVKSDQALISYQPLLPGQSSPFTVITTGNPAIKKCSLSFKTFFGGTIESED